MCEEQLRTVKANEQLLRRLCKAERGKADCECRRAADDLVGCGAAAAAVAQR